MSSSEKEKYFGHGLDVTYENVKEVILKLTDEEIKEEALHLGIEIDITDKNCAEVLAKKYWEMIEKGDIYFL